MFVGTQYWHKGHIIGLVQISYFSIGIVHRDTYIFLIISVISNFNVVCNLLYKLYVLY